jgi:hypothetical protein
VEISKGPEDKSYQLIQLETGVLTVDPWPFEDKQFELYFETRLIPQLTFKHEPEFRQAFRGAVVKEKRWIFQKKAG